MQFIDVCTRRIVVMYVSTPLLRLPRVVNQAIILGKKQIVRS